MTQATAPATSSSSPAPPATTPKDGRTSQRSLGRRLLARPEVGALIAAIGVYIFFFSVAPSFREAGSLATVLYQASVMGIMAIPVALLMIGGEFDLSAGVAVTTSALTAAILSFQLSVNVWTGRPSTAPPDSTPRMREHHPYNLKERLMFVAIA